MARSSMGGFETNDGAFLETIVGTGVTFDTAIVRTGTYSAKVVAPSGATGAIVGIPAFPLALGTYLTFHIRVTSRPASTARRIFGSLASNSINLRLNPDGTIAHYINTTLTGTSTTALTDTTKWYRIDIRAANGTSVPVMLIDGVNQLTASPSSWTYSPFFGTQDTVADTYTAYFDDIVVDTADFPGNVRVVLLKPISDNARAALWTGGSGGTTNLFDAVNNLPPVGTATESNTTQIEHAGGAAGSTDAYDANMTSYAAAGIGPSDVVNSIYYMIVHGEDVTTGTKLLNFSLASNPASASGIANFTAGADVGLLGTYPSNWTLTANTIVSAPTVTVGTSPVMRVTRPETATRVASVCFMGMYVDYTERRSPPFSRRHRNLIIR